MIEEKKSAETSTFVHLRVHSSYSLSEGAIKPEEVSKLCANNDMPAVSIADSGNLFGLLEIALSCAKVGVQPIPAVEINFVKNKDSGEEPGKLVLIAQNEVGYLNLLRLVSDSFLNGSDHLKPVISLEELKDLSEGIICLSGGYNGVLDGKITNGRVKEAENLAKELGKIFKSKFYIEINRLNQESQIKTEAELLKIAKENEIPIVATNNVFFADKSMHEAQDILTCIAESTTVMDENRKKYSKEQYFKSRLEMCELFEDLPEAIENTVNIAKRCSYMPKAEAPMLPNFPTKGGRSDAEELRDVAYKGLCMRLGVKEKPTEKQLEEYKEYFERLEYEIGIINKMQFPGYFLIVSDFIRWAKSQNIPVGPGRGSGAGSVVAWALEITGLDPLRFGLLFERFLNPERVSMPDFDIDFCQERRGEVITYVQEKYGHDKVAQIITFGKLQARAVLRDVGRVLQIPYGQVDRICKMIPFNPIDPVTLAKAIELDRDLQKSRKVMK
jgi:DNA polymerase-3 subunit alpha